MQPRTLARIESWALNVASRVKDGLKVEDSRVELKRDWPPPEKAARQLAGHANAAMGGEVLWIVGLDESDGVVGVLPSELSDWWAMMQSQFDGISPSLTDVALHIDGKSLWALAFDTSRAPFVVKNSVYGKSGGGAVSLEVPWREGSAVRSASRNDLVRLLTPISLLPEIEILDWHTQLTVYGANAGYGYGQPTGADLVVRVSMYVTPRTIPTIIPFHRCSCCITGSKEDQEVVALQTQFWLPWTHDLQSAGRTDSLTADRTNNELLIQGPCRCELVAKTNMSAGAPNWLPCSPLSISLSIHVIDAPLPILLEAEGTPQPADNKAGVSWVVSTSSGTKYS